MTFVDEIEAWVRELNAYYRKERRSCLEFKHALKGFTRASS